MPWAMGKVLGGSSSINAMAWARGHKNDWAPDLKWRGSGGLLALYPCAAGPLSEALFEGTRSLGIPSFVNQNGQMMEAGGGAALG